MLVDTDVVALIARDALEFAFNNGYVQFSAAASDVEFLMDIEKIIAEFMKASGSRD